MEPKYAEAIHHEKHMRIICIGAGASGLCFAYKLQRSFQNFSLLIYDKNPEISGTWYENRYPGCACDVPAHNYTYSFEPKSDCSCVYASAQEIKKYFVGFSDKYGLQKYIKTLHRVTGARWEEADGVWTVEVQDISSGKTFQDSCHILINAGGYLNNLAWPNVPGLGKFGGNLIHSANWDDTVHLDGRRVGLIGNGSSAVQIVPALQPIVGRLINFIRSPNWILTSISTAQRVYTQQEIDDYTYGPGKLIALRKANEAMVNSIFGIYMKNSLLQTSVKDFLTTDMKEKLENGHLKQRLIPQWDVGCRRLTPGYNYLEALQKDNVEVVYGGVIELTEHGCKCDDGNEYQVDVLVCASGFDTSFRPRFPIVGSGDMNLQAVWADTPKSYLGMAAAGFPNFFMFLGPNSPVANGPTLTGIEAQADHMLMLIDRYQTENIHSFTPKAAAVDDFVEHTHSFMEKTVWADECRSGHKNHTINDRNPTLWPGSTLHCLEALRELRADDWEIRYTGNRFAWLGNGFSQAEFDPTCDLGYMVRNRDTSPYASRRKRREVLTRSGSQPQRVLHSIHRPLPSEIVLEIPMV